MMLIIKSGYSYKSRMNFIKSTGIMEDFHVLLVVDLYSNKRLYCLIGITCDVKCWFIIMIILIIHMICDCI